MLHSEEHRSFCTDERERGGGTLVSGNNGPTKVFEGAFTASEASKLTSFQSNMIQKLGRWKGTVAWLQSASLIDLLASNPKRLSKQRAGCSDYSPFRLCQN